MLYYYIVLCKYKWQGGTCDACKTCVVSGLPVFRWKYVQRIFGPVLEPTLLLEEIEYLANVYFSSARLSVAVATRFRRLFVRRPCAPFRVTRLTAVVLTTGHNIIDCAL